MRFRSHRRSVWTIPTLLAALTVAGLLSALLGEPMAWKALAWALLAIPLLVALRFGFPGLRRNEERKSASAMNLNRTS
jgi:membrane protein implicated in regulation of membrane protease activity